MALLHAMAGCFWRSLRVRPRSAKWHRSEDGEFYLLRISSYGARHNQTGACPASKGNDRGALGNDSAEIELFYKHNGEMNYLAGTLWSVEQPPQSEALNLPQMQRRRKIYTK